MAECEEELKSLLIKVKKKSEKVVLKTQQSNKDHGIRSHQFMANRWETTEIVTDYFLALQIIADGDCCHEIKRLLLLGRKPMKNLDSVVKKQRHHFADKGPSSQRYGFSSSHGHV